MSPEAQHIAIAEICGIDLIGYAWSVVTNKEEPLGTETGQGDFFIPRYTEDLNAMHEATMQMNPALWYDYTSALRSIVMKECDKPECYVPGTERSQHIADFWFYEATAAQRAKAFLLAHNRWDESK